MPKVKVRVGDIITSDAEPDAVGVVTAVRSPVGLSERGLSINVDWSKGTTTWRAECSPSYFTQSTIHVRPGS